MNINLFLDYRKISKYIKERVKEYPVYFNIGPGKDPDPITQITLGYDFIQEGWVALIFDTRKNTEVDGEWQSYISHNRIDFPFWRKGFDDIIENKKPLTITFANHKNEIIKKQDEKLIAKVIGEMLCDVLTESQNKGVLAKLPLNDNCLLCIEHHKGLFGWRSQEEDDGGEVLLLEQEIVNVIPKLKLDEQIEYLMIRLDQMAAGENCNMNYHRLEVSAVFEYLENLGSKPVIPLLKLCSKWASRSEWKGDRPSRKITELPMNTIVHYAVWFARDVNTYNGEIKNLLKAIIRKSLKANQKRKFWGTLPYHAAECLHSLDSSYPEPKKGETDNKFKNPKEFL